MRDKKKALKPLTKRVRKILADFDDLIELHETALPSENYPAARKYGNELCEILIKHQKVFGFSDEQLTEMKEKRVKSNAGWEKLKTLEAKAEKSKIEAEQARERYFRFLLEESPEGKNRTMH